MVLVTTILFINFLFIFKLNLALNMSDTLRVYQEITCDHELMNLECPLGTKISIQSVKYKKDRFCPSLNNNLIPSTEETARKFDSEDKIFCNWASSGQIILQQSITSRCQALKSCKVYLIAEPETEFSACKDKRKFIQIDYTCRPSEYQSTIGCEEETVEIECKPGSRIVIYSAYWGRTAYESERCKQPNGGIEETCLADFAKESVEGLCLGKRRCKLMNMGDIFGNPCKLQYSRKYLKIIYTCVPKKVLKDIYQDKGANIDEQSKNKQNITEKKSSSSSSSIELLSNQTFEGSGGEEKKKEVVNIFLNKNETYLEERDVENNSSKDSINLVNTSGHILIKMISQIILVYDHLKENIGKFYFVASISVAVIFVLSMCICIKICATANKNKKKDSSDLEPRRRRKQFPESQTQSSLLASPDIFINYSNDEYNDDDDYNEDLNPFPYSEFDCNINRSNNSSITDLHSILKKPSTVTVEKPSSSSQNTKSNKDKDKSNQNNKKRLEMGVVRFCCHEREPAEPNLAKHPSSFSRDNFYSVYE